MQKVDVTPLNNLNHKVIEGISGFKLTSYLIALEGWRRGLTLKWYKDETEQCKLYRLNSSIHGIFYSLSLDDKKHYFLRSRGDMVSNKAVKICSDKSETKKILEKSRVPVPQGKEFDISDHDVMVEYANIIGYPVIIKPIGGSMGRGVFTNINNKEQLIDAIETARSTYKSTFKYKNYLVEKHYSGKEYRLYVVGDKMVGATHRIPANIIGDGQNTIGNLIEIKNRKRSDIPYLASKPIKIDSGVQYYLKKIGFDENSIPKKDERIFLRENSNITTGGDPIDATNELSIEVKKIAVDALKALPSIPHGGVDIIVDPYDNTKGVVLEINATAEIGLHSFPMEGKARDIPGAIIDYYFPESIGKGNPNFYFDYKSLLEPLKTWAAEEITVTKPPNGKLYCKKYIITGKLYKVGYMTWIKRQALKNNLIGYISQKVKNEVEIVVMNTDKNEVDKFKEQCSKGSRKSKVKSVDEEIFDLGNQDTYKVGFEIVSNN